MRRPSTHGCRIPGHTLARDTVLWLVLPIAAGAVEPAVSRHRPDASLESIHRLTPKPPLGWNSFDSYSCHLDEGDALATLDVMAQKLKPHGYEYFVVDGGWYREYELEPGTKNPVRKKGVNANQDARDRNMDEFGRYLPSRTYFPGGMKRIVDRTLNPIPSRKIQFPISKIQFPIS